MTAVQPPEAFRTQGGYRLLPFRFERLDDARRVLSNEVGESLVLDSDTLERFVRHELRPAEPAYHALQARHFLLDDTSTVALDLLAAKVHTRRDAIADFTGLHIFVVTLRCDHDCAYCQVSRRTLDRTGYDLRVEHADKALDLVFQSPSPTLKIELQGGEPLLRFDLVQHIVDGAIARNRTHRRDLAFVIATNLSHCTDEVLSFCKARGVSLSTSLDGPADLHDLHRRVEGQGSHAATVEAVQRARAVLGHDRVSALMTTTPAALDRAEDIVDEYVRLGFGSVFLRSLSPYGFATRGSLLRKSPVDDWLAFYRRGLARVVEHNQKGVPLREEFAAILLQKMLTPEGAQFVDLQSPAGLGIAGIVYDYDGAVYGSDEGRMLAQMGDATLRLGHLDTDSYEALLTGDAFLDLLERTMPEGTPGCSECGFLPWCGADPVHHLATQKDPVGHKAFSDFCRKQKGVLRHLVTLLEDHPAARDVLLGWV